MKTNKRTTKRALLLSIVSMFMCVAMLMGTTYAWFTDSVTSKNNVIKSGNLDIELDYFDGKEWKTVEGSSEILDAEALWEPGYTDVVYLRLKNAGTLALKYNLGVNIVNETAGVNAAGEKFLLSDYIYFDVAEDINGEKNAYATREEAMAIATENTKISAGYTKADALLAEQEIYIAMVIYMPTTVGNEANHNGKDIPQIDLGINVIATQLANEEDSFDQYYDGGAEWLGGYDYSWYDENATELTIGSSEQLAALAAIVNGTAAPATTYSATATTIKDSFAGQTIKLMSDIDLNNIPWTPIGNWDNAFEGTFDGNGYTISNLYINRPTEDNGSGVGLIGVAQNATIKGITVENVEVIGYERVAAIVGSPYSGCTVSDCHVTGDINLFAEWAYVGGICAYGYTKLDNCSVEDTVGEAGVMTAKGRNAVGGISAWLLEGVSAITNCSVKNLELTGWTNVGAITGFMHYLGVIDGCSAENVTMTKTREDGHPAIGLAAGGWSYNASKSITITNNTFKNITLNGTYVAVSSADVLYGAEYAGNTNTNFVIDNNSQENVTNNLIEVSEIKTVEDLKNAFANSGKYVLKNDLALTETVTVPAGVEVVLYMNGKTIAGTSTATGKNFDLIDVRGTLTVKNGTITTVHTGTNMEWNNSTNVFNVTAGGVLNVENATLENLGGSDMAFGVHLNNWGEVTLNVENSTIKSTYCAVRVFNSGYDNNNVTIKNSTLYTKGNRAFWVHNYPGNGVLNFDIFGNDNTYVAETDKLGGPIRYGFDNPVYYNAEGSIVTQTVSDLDALLLKGGNAVLSQNLVIDPSATSANSGYGKTGVAVKGGVLDGNGNTISATDAWDTWDCVVNTTGGTIKNLTITSAMRGIFMGSATADVYIDNVTIDGTIYTFNSDGGNKNYGVYISNSTLNGWTSFSDVHKEVVFTNCNFGEGNGYAFCRPYNETVFENCNFEEGFEVDAIGEVTFVNCYYNGVLITAENVSTLVISGLDNVTVANTAE